MTREEINKFLVNTKVYVNGKSKEIQEKLFSLGYKWCDGYTNVKDTESPFLFIYKYISRSNDMEYFSSHMNREITAEEILSLELTEPSLEEKFDPTTFQPFDKVLVRRSNNWYHVWYADFICVSITDNTTEHCTMSNAHTNMVIPYNDETKHLVGTSDEAPEFYRYWEE